MSARGWVFPNQNELHTVPIHDGNAIVQVEFVCPGYEDYVLELPPNDEINTLGEALLQRVQWKRGHIVVSPTVEHGAQLVLTNKTTQSALEDAIISTKELFGDKTTSKSQSGTTSPAKDPSASNP